MDKRTPTDRLNFEGRFDPVVNRLCVAYGVGDPVDFSVANWYPRIQELAVITANLLHDPDNPMSLRDKSAMVSDEYSKLNSLTVAEQHYLSNYVLAGVAMEFMGAHQEKYINGNDTEETEFWLDLGRTGLQKELT